jgi:hypothetical protein
MEHENDDDNNHEFDVDDSHFSLISLMTTITGYQWFQSQGRPASCVDDRLCKLLWITHECLCSFKLLNAHGKDQK